MTQRHFANTAIIVNEFAAPFNLANVYRNCIDKTIVSRVVILFILLNIISWILIIHVWDSYYTSGIYYTHLSVSLSDNINVDYFNQTYFKDYKVYFILSEWFAPIYSEIFA